MMIYPKKNTRERGFLVSLILTALLVGQVQAGPDDEDEKEPEKPEWIAVTGGDVYTGTGSYLRGATILAKDGKIESIGYNLFIPEDAERLDASGMRVYPGLVAISSSGLLGGSGNLKDTIDPFSSRMVLGLAAGITTTSQSNQVAKLKRGELGGAVLSEKAFTSLSWSGAGGKRGLKEKFKSTSEYLRSTASGKNW